TFNRTTTGGGSYTRTETGAGATLGDGSGSYSYGVTGGGSWHAGSISQSETGTDRYGLLETFVNPASSTNGQPGHLDFSPFGAAFHDPETTSWAPSWLAYVNPLTVVPKVISVVSGT